MLGLLGLLGLLGRLGRRTSLSQCMVMQVRTASASQALSQHARAPSPLPLRHPPRLKWLSSFVVKAREATAGLVMHPTRQST